MSPLSLTPVPRALGKKRLSESKTIQKLSGKLLTESNKYEEKVKVTLDINDITYSVISL